MDSGAGGRKTEKLVRVLLGTRPEVIKTAPVVAALQAKGIRVQVGHTGQHHDWLMRDTLLAELGVPIDQRWNLLDATEGNLLGWMLLNTQEWLAKASLVLVQGDTLTTVAGALAASLAGVPVGHIEAGLRCGDMTMPEERNRIVVDTLSTLLWAPTPQAMSTLRHGWLPSWEVVEMTGNTVADMCLPLRPPLPGASRHGVLVTLHRQSNVDDPTRLRAIAMAIDILAQQVDVCWPVHPRSAARLRELGDCELPCMQLPFGYREFLEALAKARLVVTDSGGVQEEAALLGTPCLTLRPNTERPETVTAGVNRLVTLDELVAWTMRLMTDDQLWNSMGSGGVELYGQGDAGRKIAESVEAFLR